MASANTVTGCKLSVGSVGREGGITSMTDMAANRWLLVDGY